MGLTQHAHGVDTVKALVNVGLARGLPGRPNRGLVPIRGHSGVQGGAEVGCAPAIEGSTLAAWESLWGFPVPRRGGWTAAEMVDQAAAGRIDALWIVGGNFLETLPDVDRSRRALSRPRLRIHHDIVLSSSMLVEGEGDVLILPATTRYEAPGGGTETTTERRIVFSPEVSGRRVGSAKPEWWVFGEVMARVRPEQASAIRFTSAAAIRSEIARAVPLYQGIESLEQKGDQMQWGGANLYADGHFATADGKARFTPIVTGRIRGEPEPGRFHVSTRRGKQFNSMIQREVDPLTGAERDAIFVSAEDLARLGLREGEAVRLRAPSGEFVGRVFEAAIRPGNLEVHWPEGNALLGHGLDPDSLEPDYNGQVSIERLTG
jgi:predicted molibdopterin-dependent oxidoreductase YjgC